MSMLAERRTKVRWILNPRSNQWSDDNTKFGHRLMEKMGWKAGNGLGANQQGSTAHIKVSVRNDNRGIGFKGRPEDILPHQDNFADLLQQLSAATPEAPLPVATQTSLEEKSQQSKARVHYHKFTRGKDLSRYSQKDLACILGKSVPRHSAAVSSPSCEASVLDSDVATIDRGNMVDYFKSKKPLFSTTAFQQYSDQEEEDEKPCFGFGFKHTGDEDKPSCGFGFQENTDIKEEFNSNGDNKTAELLMEENDTASAPTVKRKKSKKRSAENDDSTNEEKHNLQINVDIKQEPDVSADNETTESTKEECDAASAPTERRRKSKKRSTESDDTLDVENTKKHKSKRIKLDASDVIKESSDHLISNDDKQIKKKKKKKKNTNKDEDVAVEEIDVKQEVSEKKKRKKDKDTPEEEEKQSKKDRKEAKRLRKQGERRKSVTFSAELFEVVEIPPREEAGETIEPEQDETSEPKQDEASEQTQEKKIDVQVVDGNRYINGICDHLDTVVYKYKAERKTDAQRAIPREVRKDVVISGFPGANIHNLGGYAGLNRTPQRV